MFSKRFPEQKELPINHAHFQRQFWDFQSKKFLRKLSIQTRKLFRDFTSTAPVKLCSTRKRCFFRFVCWLFFCCHLRYVFSFDKILSRACIWRLECARDHDGAFQRHLHFRLQQIKARPNLHCLEASPSSHSLVTLFPSHATSFQEELQLKDKKSVKDKGNVKD